MTPIPTVRKTWHQIQHYINARRNDAFQTCQSIHPLLSLQNIVRARANSRDVPCHTGSYTDHHAAQDVRRGRDLAAGPGRVGAGAGVRAGRGDVVRGVASDQLHSVPRLHHQQHQRRRVVVADCGLLQVPGGGCEREHELRVSHPHRQRAARPADQPDTRHHAAQGLQLHVRPASVHRYVGSTPSSRPRRSLSCVAPAAANDAGVASSDGGAHRDHAAEQPEPGADETAGCAQLCLEGQRWCVRDDCRRWSHAGLIGFEFVAAVRVD